MEIQLIDISIAFVLGILLGAFTGYAIGKAEGLKRGLLLSFKTLHIVDKQTKGAVSKAFRAAGMTAVFSDEGEE